MNWDEWSFVIGMAATVAFAVTAVLALRQDRDVDLVGAVVLGLITAIGGGTIRDVVLDVPVFWSTELSYIWVGSAASIAAFYGMRFFQQRHTYALMVYLDGLGAVMFGVQAAGKVWDHGFGLPVAPVILGMITAVGGGLTRDVLAGRTTLLLKPELYATPVICGAATFTLVLNYAPEYRAAGSMVCIVGAFAFRAAAIHWNLQMPQFARGGPAAGA